MRTALTIAGSDSSGGAGIQADIKTMISNGVYAMSAITALTAQNTTGVTGIMEATPEFLADQLDNIFTDMVKTLYITDTSTNVLPSIHVFNSLACCGAILKNQRKYKKSTDTACVVLTILIIMSTMFLKQHSVVDVVLAALMYTGCYRIIYGNELWSQNAFRTSIFSDHS